MTRDIEFNLNLEKSGNLADPGREKSGNFEKNLKSLGT